jgi:hypothetical protein
MTFPPEPPGGQPSSSSIEQQVQTNQDGTIVGQAGNVYKDCTFIEQTNATPSGQSPTLPESARIFLSYKRDVAPDEVVATEIFEALRKQHHVFVDRSMPLGRDWVKAIHQEIFQADAIIVLLSEAATHSEMVCTEIELAMQSQKKRQGLPLILPVRLAYEAPFTYPLNAYLGSINWASWETPADTHRLIIALRKSLAGEPLPVDTESTKRRLQQTADTSRWEVPTPSAQPISRTGALTELEQPDQGTMRLDSKFYIERPEDGIALSAIKQPGVTITIKGARQMGKSSLLNRIKAAAHQAGKQVVFIDFQLFDQGMAQDPELFFQQFCLFLVDELDLEDCVADYWQRPQESNRQRCNRFMRRHVLKQINSPLVLAMDEVESIFDTPCRTDFFGMLRSWHNQRASSPLWQQLDLALVTSTEPYQLIDDLNQSPFNVGEVLELDDFTPTQVAELNRRHGEPLPPEHIQQLMALLHGHPYLVRRALYLVASGRLTPTELFQSAAKDRGPFGDHLRNHLTRLYERPDQVTALLQVIRNYTCPDRHLFFSLRGAGLIRRDNQAVVPRCQLYADYFRENLRG